MRCCDCEFRHECDVVQSDITGFERCEKRDSLKFKVKKLITNFGGNDDLNKIGFVKIKDQITDYDRKLIAELANSPVFFLTPLESVEIDNECEWEFTGLEGYCYRGWKCNKCGAEETYQDLENPFQHGKNYCFGCGKKIVAVSDNDERITREEYDAIVQKDGENGL